MDSPSSARVTLLSLNPEEAKYHSIQELARLRSTTYYMFPILGRAQLSPRQAAVAFRDIRAITGKNEGKKPDACFYPRHGIRIEKDGHVHDFSICYSCGRYKLYRDGSTVAYYGLEGKADTMNKILHSRNLPLAP
jgi:hypothetical protein